jgi:hypothetical protein
MTAAMWNEGRTGILIERAKGSYVFLESGPEFEQAALTAVDWVPPTPSLEDARAAMVCSPAQMRVALHRAGLLASVQAIADADAEASIIWEYATQIVRNSPLIDALGGPNGFTPEQIDDLFRAAMAVDL